MHDRDGKPLQVGDQVTINATVKQLTGDGKSCTAVVEFTDPGDDSEVYRPEVACNTRNLVLDGRPEKGADEQSE